MRRALLGFAVLLGSACGGWGVYSPAPRVPFDPRLGVKVMDGDPLIAVRLNAGAVGPSKLFVSVVQPRGRKSDLATVQAPRSEVYEVDFATSAVRKLPDPPVSLALPPTFAATWSPSVTLLRGDDDTFVMWNGASWQALPAPPGDASSAGPMLVADERHVILERLDRLAAFDGTQWVTAPKKGQLGPVDASGVRVVFGDERGLCTELLSWTTLQPQAPAICTANAMQPSPEPVLNGRVDDFQLVADGAVFHFSNGAWVRGVSVPASSALVPMPGATTIPLRQQLAAQIPSHLSLRGGSVTGLLTPQMNVAYDCACRRSEDPACGCVPLDLSDAPYFFLNDGSGLVSLTVPTVDARRAVFARKVELPLSQSPWGPVCNMACGVGERCEVTFGTQGFRSEVCVSNDPMTSVPRGRLLATVRQANPGTVTVTLTGPDGGVSGARVVSGPPNLVLEGPPLEPVVVTLTLPGHALRVLDVRFPDAARTADLGDVPLIGAQFLSTERARPGPWWTTAVTSAGALLVAHQEADAGFNWFALQLGTDGGVEQRVLAPGRWWNVKPLWLPRQHRVVVPGPSSLAAFDDVTLEPRGTLTGEFSGLMAASSFTDVALLEVVGSSLVRFGPQGMSEVAYFTSQFSAQQLSADGGVAVRKLSNGTWEAGFADGTTRALPNIPSLATPVLEATGRALLFRRNETLVEIELATGTERTLAQSVTMVAAGARTDRVVASGSVQDGGTFTPFTDLYASGLRQGPFADGPFIRVAPGGGWLNFEDGGLALRTIDDGVTRATFPGVDWRIVPLTDEGFAALPDDQSRATDVQYFVDGLRTATLAKSTVGAPFGPGDTRLLSGRRVYRYDPATGALSEPWFFVDDTTSFDLDPTFQGLASVPSFNTLRKEPTRGMPCATFSVANLAWDVAPDGTVRPTGQGVDLFCAQ